MFLYSTSDFIIPKSDIKRGNVGLYIPNINLPKLMIKRESTTIKAPIRPLIKNFCAVASRVGLPAEVKYKIPATAKTMPEKTKATTLIKSAMV